MPAPLLGVHLLYQQTKQCPHQLISAGFSFWTLRYENEKLLFRSQEYSMGEEDNLFNKWCWENWKTKYRRINLDLYLTLLKKINSKWTEDFDTVIYNKKYIFSLWPIPSTELDFLSDETMIVSLILLIRWLLETPSSLRWDRSSEEPTKWLGGWQWLELKLQS